MATLLYWNPQENNPANVANLATIGQWWEKLHEQEIQFAQRLIPPNGNVEDINWDTQRFDEKFVLQDPQLRGITLYWQKTDSENERNFTPSKLEFNLEQQYLDIYPQSQPQVLIRVSLVKPVYQLIELINPQIAGTTAGENCVLLLQDNEQNINVKVTLSPTALGQLLESLPG